MAYSVLIVDDSPAMRKFIRRVLDLSGLEIGACQEAENGKEALALLRAQWVDIVLTDVNMPVMNGEKLLAEMAADAVLKSVPAIVVTTDHSEQRVERMLALGARDYVTKPFLPETLRDTMEKQLMGEKHAGLEY